MSVHHFVWTDLSTYDMHRARADYAALFGWQFDGDESYDFAMLGGEPAAAVFPMPPKLADANMPSFWMSYVRVADVAASVAQARGHEGAIIEVEPQASGSDTRVALVRDPSGAGFTLYEGPEIDPPSQPGGAVAERTLHVPTIALVEAFYADMFGWRFVYQGDEPWPRYAIVTAGGDFVAWIEEVPEELRGTFRYWMPCFAVTDLDGVVETLTTRGGEVAHALPDGRAMCCDGQGAHFLIRSLDAPAPTPILDGGADAAPPSEPETEAEAAPSEADTAPARSLTTTFAALPGNAALWRTGVGIACIWVAVVLNIQTFWGILFLVWTWPALKSGTAYFIDPVEKAKSPTLYWALIGTWIVLSLWMIAADLGRFFASG